MSPEISPKWADILAEPNKYLGPPPRKVSEELFYLAYTNKDNLYVAKNAIRKFSKKSRSYDGLDTNQMAQVIRTAIFNALRLHDFSKNKFTTSVVAWVQWDAHKEIHLNKKSNEISAKILKRGTEPCNKVGFADNAVTLKSLKRPSELEQLIEQEDEKERVQSMLSLIPGDLAEVVYLNVVEGYSSRKIARKLGVSFLDVELKIKEGLSALKQELEEEKKWIRKA